MSLCSSLDGSETERETVWVGCSDLAGLPFVIVKINDLGIFLE
jgi:hypothetical protein